LDFSSISFNIPPKGHSAQFPSPKLYPRGKDVQIQMLRKKWKTLNANMWNIYSSKWLFYCY